MILNKYLKKALQLILIFLMPFASQAYEVQTNSSDNIIFVLLNNPSENGSLSSITLTSQNPSFVTTSDTYFTPIQIPAGKSDIIGLSFDVAAYAPSGISDDLTLTVQGIISGQLVEFDIDIPLTTVSTAPEAQGYVGFGVPSSSLGDSDNDGDGVSDIIELAYGSDPNGIDSIPGIIDENIPAFGVFGYSLLAILLATITSLKNKLGLNKISFKRFLLFLIFLLPAFYLFANNSTRIQLIHDVPVVEIPIPVVLSSTATASTYNPAPEFSGTGGPNLAIDNNMNTRWESNHNTDPSWLTLDFGATYDLTELVIHWEAANALTYEVQGSRDNQNWTKISEQTGGLFGDRTDVVPLSGVYRYLRIYGKQRSVGNLWGYSIWETSAKGSRYHIADFDDDGVFDDIDQCLETPAGASVDSNGCEIISSDSDNDGVIDDLDNCPGTLINSIVDANGCAIINVNEVSSSIVQNDLDNDGEDDRLLVGGAASSQPGFTLYVFDPDLNQSGSICNGGCATNWPPLLTSDGIPSGVNNLGTITRDDGETQVTYNGRPLYFFINDTNPGDTNGHGAGGVWWAVPYSVTYVPLYDASTILEPPTQVDTPTALITRVADRARDRHAREVWDNGAGYDHYLSHYWEHRTAEIEIVDKVAKGGNEIVFNVTSEWQLRPLEAELRFFHLSMAKYADNGVMTALPELDVPGEDRRHYTRSVSLNRLYNRPLQVGDLLEFELSHFLKDVPRGRNAYYGTAILYVVGEGIVPFEGVGGALNPSPMPLAGRLGGDTTLNYQYSNEPEDHLLQLSTNLSNINGQNFVLGRRVHHTDMGNGSHDETPINPHFYELSNTLGPRYTNRSCVGCHRKNGRALAGPAGTPLDKYSVFVGDSAGNPHPDLGRVFQAHSLNNSSEGTAILSSWTENDGLRSPNYAFSDVSPTNFSARIAPQLVGMGLLEAIDEATLENLADPDDADGDGISGKLRIVNDPITGEPRVGRFGWKASEASVLHQVTQAFNTDMGVTSSVRPDPDCGTNQSGCGASGSEIDDLYIEQLTKYISLLGVSARRDLNDPVALQGEQLFNSIGCNSCHVSNIQTSNYHPHTELRNQTIHPYTDLLLHDMGPGLASTLIEGNAEPQEWRTAPLWSIGLTEGVSGGEGYLHDGRARTLDEAIRWHGGEAQGVKEAYEALSQSEKDAIITFLKTL